MAIFDCFQYFNEEHIAEIRFNILNEFVDTFVIVESTVNHQGKTKKLHFDINKYKKFKSKIIYIEVNDTPENIYNKPSNTFVSDFIGSPSMNLIRGKLKENSGNIFFKTSGSNLEIPIKDYDF